MEYHLKISEDHYRAFIENSYDGFCLLNAHGVITYISPQSNLMSGFVPNEFVGKNGFEFIHPEDQNFMREQLSVVLAKPGGRVIATCRHKHKLGGWIDVEMLAVNLLEDTKVQSVLLTVKNISERSQIISKLKESEMRFQVFSDLSTEGVLIHQDGIVADVNGTLAKMMEYADESEMIGKELLGFVCPEYHTKVIDNIKNKVTEPYEIAVICKSGRVIPILALARHIQYNGREARAGVLRDLTQEKITHAEHQKMQNQLIHSSKLAAIGTLSAGMAHEINNPLTIIKGNVNIMRELIDKGVEPSRLMDFTDKLLRAIDRISTIINSLRNYARADTEHVEVVDIHRVILDTLSLCEMVYKKQGVTIETNLQSSKAYVVGNIGKFQQVIMNLVNNSRDALLNRGKGIIRIETSEADQKIYIRITDDGEGIDPRHTAHIFDPFFTTKAPGMGTGLGLPIVHSILSSFGGTIAVDSMLGLGSVFTISLPLASSTNLKKEIASGFKKQFIAKEKIQVLVVDDEKEICDLIVNFLSEMKLKIDVVHDGLSALNKIKTKSYDLVLTDLKMPHMSGYELLVEARRCGFKELKFVIVTGGIITDYSEEQREIVRANASGYIRKPFSKEGLIASIEKVLVS